MSQSEGYSGPGENCGDSFGTAVRKWACRVRRIEIFGKLSVRILTGNQPHKRRSFVSIRVQGNNNNYGNDRDNIIRRVSGGLSRAMT